jgi:hypothetical protein
MQEFLECMLQREVDLVVFQDNSAVIQIVDSGYSPKLRHLKKVFKINIGSIHEWFKDNSTSRFLYIKTALQRLIHSQSPSRWRNGWKHLNLNR